MDLKQHKELEQRVHETLYNNIYLLTAIYPPTKEFNLIFRKDMFVKNNKKPFFEVIHYLLNILNPQITKEKLTSWPVFDIKQETKFRSELISYLNEINSKYASADLPLVQASSLVSPGGFRFAKFMLKVSELVLYEHLNRSGKELLPLPRIVKGTPQALIKTQADLIQKQTLFIEKKIEKIIHDFEKYYLESQQKAEEISDKLIQVSKDIKNAKIELDKIQHEFNLKYPAYPSEESLYEKLNALKTQVKEVINLKSLFVNCEKLIEILKSSDYTLDHDESNFIVPNEIEHMITNKKELDLIEYLKAISFLLEKKSLRMPNPTDSFVQDVSEKLKSLTLKYEIILRDLILQENQFEVLTEELTLLFENLQNSDCGTL